MSKLNESTPLMKQYSGIKSKYPDALLLFRVGDFYETFGEDAIKASKVLGIVQTYRNNGSNKLELAGFPYHSLDTYLPKLVRAGYRVAICDQLEDPKSTKTIVKRGVTELVTPGVAINDQILEHKSNNFLASVFFEKQSFGVAFIDISTGEFYVSEGSQDEIKKLINTFSPGEILYQKHVGQSLLDVLDKKYPTYALEEWVYHYDHAYALLKSLFETQNLKGFGVENLSTAIISAGAIVQYLQDTQHHSLKHIKAISRIEEDAYVWLDGFTLKNLEIFDSPHKDAITLLQTLDQTVSPMGARLLRRWLMFPLKDLRIIEDRQQTVEFFLQNEIQQQQAIQLIKEAGDIERLISKVSVGKINPREVLQLKRGLDIVEPLKAICESSKFEPLQKMADQFNPCSGIRKKIDDYIQPESPAVLAKGNVIKSGVNNELDELRNIAFSGKDYLIKLQQREIESTGIPSLKIGFNNIFGYYLEVTHTHKNKVPETWIRKQTLVNAERYVTEELKEYETKILGAQEKIGQLELEIYQKLIGEISDYIKPIQHNASQIAALDALLNFSVIAQTNKYIKPTVHKKFSISIENARHPVIEKRLPAGESYVPNNIYLDSEVQQIIMITGPNMSGKSAILRQTALIVIMAQIGCYVPAKKAEIGLVDRIFTRVGASDNISSGESTFMVEMIETASILNNLSSRSLVLLDEIGRGTSTYDGISIAWAIAEYLHNHPGRPKTLFATHYHELNNMSKEFERIKNYNVSVKEVGQKILFLRKLVEGGSAHSFGIHVAKMAGVPNKVVERANQILKQLEKNRNPEALKSQVSEKMEENFQLSFFQLDDPVLLQVKEQISNTDINSLTPVEALIKLNEIKKLIG